MELNSCFASKRIREEYYQMQSNPSDDFKCGPVERYPYDWQFGIRGASGTDFEGGIYHGRIQFSEEYPLKPPSFTLLTENGRFKTQTKIRISRLNHWQPSWSLGDCLRALIGEMPTYPDGELGSVENNREKRRDLAIKSRAATPKYGTAERQKVIDEIHEYLLSKSPPVPVPQIQLTRNTPCQEELVVDRIGSTQMEWDQGVIAEEKCNIKNSGEKRILDEYNDIESNPSCDFKCLMLDRNPYEWQFAIRGPSGTEFEGGIYHGLIQFSKEYPSKPPSIMFLTKNGRHKIQTDISSRLLSSWQSPRSVRNALLALIEEMPTYPDGDGELGSVQYDKKSRHALAIKSRAAALKYGNAERQKVIDEIHKYMLSKAPPVPQQLSSLSQDSKEHEHEHEHYQNDGAKRKHRRGGTSGDSVFTVTENIIRATNSKYVVGIFDFKNDRRITKPFQVRSTRMEWDRGVIAEDKCNIKKSGAKRILDEYNDIESNPSRDFKCLKLDRNPYEWQFAIRGPSGTEFEGGIYHGLIQFSEEYPSKPPSIMFLTKNGRRKIQIDISSRLLSNWQSPRSVRNALLALIEEMPAYPDGDGELGSVQYDKKRRHALAIKSRAAAPKYGTAERQKVIDEIHEYMLRNAPPVPELRLSSPSQDSKEHEHEYYQNDGAKRKHGRGGTSGGTALTVTRNIIHPTNSNSVEIFDFKNDRWITKLFWVFFFLPVLFGFLSTLPKFPSFF